MADSFFLSFHRSYPLSDLRTSYDPSKHGKFTAKVPSKLVSEWQNFGFGAYSDGLLWLTSPDEPVLDTSEWQGLKETAIGILRTAFGDVCLWQDDHFIWVNVLSGKTEVCDPNIEILFDGFTDSSFRKIVLLERLFKWSCNRYGNLKSDECFGFAPIPSLGGAIAEEYIVKVKIRPYLSMIAQTF